jgi:RNA polymerase sigma-70 factor (ECF subfamily)
VIAKKQQTFCKSYSCVPALIQTVSARWRIRAWLYRAARNLLIDEYRTTREFVELEEDAPLTDASPDAISTLDICLPETLQALPEDERWIEESDLNRRPQQSLADELGITLTAFKSRLLRARKHLKETMTELCQIEADDTSSVCCHKKMN